MKVVEVVVVGDEGGSGGGSDGSGYGDEEDDDKKPNTHRPSFHVNMVGLEKSQRANSSRYPWDLDAEMTDEEEEFELWLQQALASGLFCETSKRRKSWSPKVDFDSIGHPPKGDFVCGGD
ncbi:hypothetical protein QVD17_27073 [Tagetes erecta]|uniref:Uncharacterized protein n=1 Tax=Tagetes erecta TaxID=13708 RepID=A0AAD8K823_TARER|nr:hypothetical protein QVD17_27073 [Tagetes erecta]